MQNMIGKDFDNLPQRSIYYFLSTMPSFRPIKSNEASEDQQRSAYYFIKGVYEKLYNDPTLLGFKLEPDDSFSDWEMQKTKPNLPVKIRGTIKKVEEFLSFLYTISLNGKRDGDVFILPMPNYQIKRSVMKQLQTFDVAVAENGSNYSVTFPHQVSAGLALLARISCENTAEEHEGRRKHYLLFSRGVFDAGSKYTREVFGSLSANLDAFIKLTDFLERRRYTRVDCRKHHISLDYVKAYSNKDEPLRDNWAERIHGGIEICYEELRKNQLLIGLRIPYFAEILNSADKMPEKVKRFVLQRSKKCDNCRYCVQTDKTGTRPLIYKDVDGQQICPLFAGFQYQWRSMDEETVDNITAMLEYIDKQFKARVGV